MKPKIILGTDHAGFELKEMIKKYLIKEGYEVEDKGAYRNKEDDDYPDFILPAAEEVARDLKNNKGIIFGGSGQGEAIVANKVAGIRAAVYYGYNPKIVKLSRQHNNANVLSLGARFLTKKQATEAVRGWLTTPFTNKKKHYRRIKKIERIEK